jgi:hypothetical protein
MGVEKMHPPRYWQMRAEEFRTKADNCENPATRDVLRKVAVNYDELARRAQRIRTVECIDAQQTEQARQAIKDYAGDRRDHGKLGQQTT